MIGWRLAGDWRRGRRINAKSRAGGPVADPGGDARCAVVPDPERCDGDASTGRRNDPGPKNPGGRNDPERPGNARPRPD